MRVFLAEQQIIKPHKPETPRLLASNHDIMDAVAQLKFKLSEQASNYMKAVQYIMEDPEKILRGSRFTVLCALSIAIEHDGWINTEQLHHKYGIPRATVLDHLQYTVNRKFGRIYKQSNRWMFNLHGLELGIDYSGKIS